jgi:hypothetical protein
MKISAKDCNSYYVYVRKAHESKDKQKEHQIIASVVIESNVNSYCFSMSVNMATREVVDVFFDCHLTKGAKLRMLEKFTPDFIVDEAATLMFENLFFNFDKEFFEHHFSYLSKKPLSDTSPGFEHGKFGYLIFFMDGSGANCLGF